MGIAGDGGTPMAEEAPRNTDGSARNNLSGAGAMSKKLANKIAAAKVYEAAMRKAGEDVPESVRKLARRTG